MKPGPGTSNGPVAGRSRTWGLAAGDRDLRVGGCDQFLTELAGMANRIQAFTSIFTILITLLYSCDDLIVTENLDI